MINRLGKTGLRWVWAAVILLMPLTSLPLVGRLLGSAAVAAPSGVLLLVLVIGFLLPYTLRGGAYPRQSLPLFAFVIAALVSCAAAFFINFPPFKAASVADNELEGFLTLAVGVCFYLVTALWPRSEKDFSLALRLVNWAGLAILIWSGVQLAAWYSLHRYPSWLRDLQDLISLGPLYRQRPTGFTLEPSWLANQLNMLYLAYWLAASVRRSSAHRWRIWKFSFENLLLVGGVVLMVLSLSRVGQLGFFLMLAYLVVRANLRLSRWLEMRLSTRAVHARRRWISAVILIGMVLIYLALLLGLAFGMSRLDPRMTSLFQFDLQHENPFLHYANQLLFAARVVYWQTGWEVFNDHPILGVGLGNAGYYFPEKMSGFGWGLMEVRKLIFRQPGLPNTKSLWMRLLAETGVVGFAFFVCWLLLCWWSASRLEKVDNPLYKTIALMAQLVILGLLLEGFSLDTFALPYLWFSLGLVTAAVFRRPAPAPSAWEENDE